MKKITIIFTTSHSDTLGNACRLEMIDFLSSHFDVTIVTNEIDLVKNRYKNCEMIEFKPKRKVNIPIISDIAEWKKMAKYINDLSSDLIFMFDDTSSCFMAKNQSSNMYTNTVIDHYHHITK